MDFVCQKHGKGHWLGKGVYFFEDLYYAVEWQSIGVLKVCIADYDEVAEKCGIIESCIDIDNYETLDLSTPYGYSIFEELLNQIKKSTTEQQFNRLKEKGDRYLISFLEKMEEKTGEKNISKFDVVCAHYNKKIIKQSEDIPENFIKCIQKQICVKNMCAITQSNEYTNQKELKKYYNLVSKNRRRCI